jgi:hypothetical protein
MIPAQSADRVLAALFGMQWNSRESTDAALERDRTRDRIRMVHSFVARRRLRALGGRRLT